MSWWPRPAASISGSTNPNSGIEVWIVGRGARVEQQPDRLGPVEQHGEDEGGVAVPVLEVDVGTRPRAARSTTSGVRPKDASISGVTSERFLASIAAP